MLAGDRTVEGLHAAEPTTKPLPRLGRATLKDQTGEYSTGGNVECEYSSGGD